MGTHLMHSTRRAVGALSLAVLTAVTWPVTGGLSAAADGLYTRDQAARGRTIFRRDCASCHREDLNGRKSDGGPALRGTEFLNKWRGQPVTEMLRPARELMPAQHPGALDRRAYIDVIAYILEQNGAPVGDLELPADETVLKDIIVKFGPRR